MLPVGATGTLSGARCVVTQHTKLFGAHQSQLLEFDTFTGWNWQGVQAPATTQTYNLDPNKYYHWVPDGPVPGWVPDPAKPAMVTSSLSDTLRPGQVFAPRVMAPPQKPKMKCIHCTNGNDYAEPNMTGGRFICHGCKSTDWWRYEGEIL